MVDLASAIVAGLTRNEFGKNAVEMLNLVACPQGPARVEKFAVDAALTAICGEKRRDDETGRDLDNSRAVRGGNGVFAHQDGEEP